MERAETGKRRQFDAAFKAEAVRMVTEGGYSQAEAARQLGIEAKRISHWKKQLEQHPPKGHPPKSVPFPVKVMSMVPNWLG